MYGRRSDSFASNRYTSPRQPPPQLGTSAVAGNDCAGARFHLRTAAETCWPKGAKIEIEYRKGRNPREGRGGYVEGRDVHYERQSDGRLDGATKDAAEAYKFLEGSESLESVKKEMEGSGAYTDPRVGEASPAKEPGCWNVPVEVSVVKKHNLAMRSDNPAKRFVVDGGI